MTLKEISHGPVWTIWIVFVVFAIISIVMLSGRGANLIAGYNTASKEQKSKVDETKLCRVIGFGMLIITILIVVLGVGESVLPAWTAYVSCGIIVLDCIVMIILANTICRKPDIAEDEKAEELQDGR